MKLTLPETLLLFGLHDDKGTVHSAAFLALEPALRGAVISELKLCGAVQIRAEGEARWHPDPPAPPRNPLLQAAIRALQQAPSPAPVTTWLAALAIGMPDLRAQVQASLERRGVLGPARVGEAVAVLDPTVGAALRQQVVWALEDGDAVTPRLGMLIGLTVACHLANLVFEDQADEADMRATWVADRDAVLRAVVESIAETEGW